MGEKKKKTVVTKKELKVRLQEISRAVTAILKGVEDPELKKQLQEIDDEYSQISETMKAGYEGVKKSAIEYENNASAGYSKQWEKDGGDSEVVNANANIRKKTKLKTSVDSSGRKYDVLIPKYREIGVIQARTDISDTEKKDMIRAIITSEEWNIIFDGLQDPEFERKFADIKKYLEELKSPEYVRTENSLIESAITIRSGIVVLGSIVGKFTADATAKRYSILSKYYALNGDEDKQKELLQKARDVAQRRIGRIKRANISTIQMVRNAQKIYNKTDNYDERAEKEKQIRARINEYEESPLIQGSGEDRESYEKRVERHKKNIKKAKTRTDAAQKTAHEVNDFLHDSAILATAFGMDRTANALADMSINISNSVLEYAKRKNEQLCRAEFGFTEKRTQNTIEIVDFFKQLSTALKTREGIEGIKGVFEGISLKVGSITKKYKDGKGSLKRRLTQNASKGNQVHKGDVSQITDKGDIEIID